MNSLTRGAPLAAYGATWNATWYGYDGHGSVRFLTNGAGQITDRYDYDAFGVLLAASGATYNCYRYCGERYENSLGLYYLRARFMNAANGRFWSADSYEGRSEEPQSTHRYVYSHADAVNGRDPSGFEMEFDAAKGVEAHILFEAYATAMGIQFYHNTPIRYIFPKYWGVPHSGSAPDVTGIMASEIYRKKFFELKPISHKTASWLADMDQEQLGRYESFLHAEGIYRGESSTLVPCKLMIGYIPEVLGGYEVWVEPAADVTFIQGKKYYTKGLVYYWLRDDRLLEEVATVTAAGVLAQRMLQTTNNIGAMMASQASRSLARRRWVVLESNETRSRTIQARIASAPATRGL